MDIEIIENKQQGKFIVKINNFFWLGSFVQILNIKPKELMSICVKNNIILIQPTEKNKDYKKTQQFLIFNTEKDAQNTVKDLLPYIIIKKLQS